MTNVLSRRGFLLNKSLLGLTLAAVAAPLAFASAVPVERVFDPPLLSRGNLGVRDVIGFGEAQWIAAPNFRAAFDAANAGAFARFRRAFDAKGDEITLHVSGDQRFVLLLDGEVIARGPDRGLVNNWQFQSYRLRPAAGRHLLEAVVWQLGEKMAPLAQLSIQGAFILKADGAYDKILSTGRGKWEVGVLRSTSAFGYTGRAWGGGANFLVRGTGFLDEQPEKWEKPVPVERTWGRSPNYGARSHRWLLYPSQLPDQTERVCAPGRFRASAPAFGDDKVPFASENAADPFVAGLENLRKTGTAFVVPAHAKVKVAWDLEDYYCAYPELGASGGRGAEVRWGWTEAPRDVATEKKVKRSEIAGRYLVPSYDRFVCDGRAAARFTSPWWRCGRWCQIEISTADEPLTLTRLAMVETRYPLERESAFACDDPTVDGISRICLRGMQMCCHEMLFDCPFYEQQMYPGDTRVQLMVLGAVTRDDRIVKRAIEIYDYDRRDNGMVAMNAPTTGLQESGTYTLCQLLMYGDYVRWHADLDWLRARRAGMRHTLAGLEYYEGADGLLRDLPGWLFMDWAPQWDNKRYRGVAIGSYADRGPCALVNLFWVLAQQSAADVEEALGDAAMAARCRAKAAKSAESVRRLFWDEGRGLVADTVDHAHWSEHAQCLALLGNVLEGDRAARAFKGLVSEPDLTRCTVYFSHYLFETYFKFGRGDLFLKRLDLWREYVRRDLKTPLEAPDGGKNGQSEARSDCHAWGSHPLFFMQRGLAGVTPDAPCFARVRVAPSPGELRRITARTPHPKGFVECAFAFEGDGVKGVVTTPVAGEFVWRGRTVALRPGRNEISVR